MPRLVKTALLAACLSLALCAACELIQEGSFARRFLVHAAGLDHRAVVLAAPVVRMVSTLASGTVMAVLVLALAMGKNWARKTYIVLAVLQCAGAGFALAVMCVQCLPASVMKDLHSIRWWVWANVAIDVFVVVVLFMRDAKTWYREDSSIENKWKNRFQCLTFWGVMIVVGAVCGMVQAVATGIADPRTTAGRFPRIRVAELKARADLGDAPSMWRLGNWEKNGWLGEKHPDKAFEWYKKAADLGDKLALGDLGDCYEKGLGVEKDLDKAREWYEKAARRGNKNAQKRLDALSAEDKQGEKAAK